MESQAHRKKPKKIRLTTGRVILGLSFFGFLAAVLFPTAKPDLVQTARSEKANVVRIYRQRMKDLKSQQKAERILWEKQEREKRHLFFLEHKGGPERRTFVKDFLERRKNMLRLHEERRMELVNGEKQELKAIEEKYSGARR